MKDYKILTKPEQIFGEYKKGTDFKNGIGKRGITGQSTVNERFYVGDQWHGANVGDRPLVRRNLIKRIGEYKIATVTSSPIAVNYTADGIPEMTEDSENRKALKTSMMNGELPTDEVKDDEVSVVMSALSNYFSVTAERVKLDSVKEQALRNAYISGTGLIWSYWDDTVETGLYADMAKKTAIKGDIMIEVVDVEQVVFGDPNNDSVQNQPYIIIAQRLDVEHVRREARKYNVSKDEIVRIKPDGADGYTVAAGEFGEYEPTDSNRVTVLTKVYKEWDEKTGLYKVMCTKVCEKTVIREPFDMKIKSYPLAKMNWERRRSCIYGESEITFMIPNQIAINRALSAEVWALMSAGMPVTIVNGDIVTGQYTNTPGKVIKVYGDSEAVASAVKLVSPAAFAGQLINGINDLANNTLSDNGANDAALGNIRPDNAAAIIQLREASLAPMQVYMNRFYDMTEDLARIWADFWLHLYGDRKIKLTDKSGTHYFPFSAERYKNLVINAKIDVGASTLWSESVVISTLDGLLQAQLITFEQYLERLPAGIIPDVTGLLEEIRQQSAVAAEAEYENNELSDESILQMLAAERPDLYEKFATMPPELQQIELTKMRGAMNGANDLQTAEEVNI